MRRYWVTRHNRMIRYLFGANKSEERKSKAGWQEEGERKRGLEVCGEKRRRCGISTSLPIAYAGKRDRKEVKRGRKK